MKRGDDRRRSFRNTVGSKGRQDNINRLLLEYFRTTRYSSSHT